VLQWKTIGEGMHTNAKNCTATALCCYCCHMFPGAAAVPVLTGVQPRQQPASIKRLWVHHSRWPPMASFDGCPFPAVHQPCPAQGRKALTAPHPHPAAAILGGVFFPLRNAMTEKSAHPGVTCNAIFISIRPSLIPLLKSAVIADTRLCKKALRQPQPQQ
jgi:hypothetical protein